MHKEKSFGDLWCKRCRAHHREGWEGDVQHGKFCQKEFAKGDACRAAPRQPTGEEWPTTRPKLLRNPIPVATTPVQASAVQETTKRYKAQPEPQREIEHAPSWASATARHAVGRGADEPPKDGMLVYQ